MQLGPAPAATCICRAFQLTAVAEAQCLYHVRWTCAHSNPCLAIANNERLP